MSYREGLGAEPMPIEIIAKRGIVHAIKCTQSRYDTQEKMYPPWVLDQFSERVHSTDVTVSLRDARKRANLSQEALGRAVGSGRSTIVKLENGMLPISESWANRLAPALGVRPDQLYEGPQVRVIGYVGAGARVYAYDDLIEAGETIPRPPVVTGDLLAVEVKGESMLPLAEEGWHIVYTAEATVDEQAVLNRVCVVQLDEDGSMLVKRVVRGSKPYHYHLLSTNAQALEDKALRWAAVVKAIVPR